MADFHDRERDRRSNKEAARLLRGLKEELDRVKERGEEAGSITLSRRARETLGATDEVVVTERDSRDMQWLEGTWGFDEWATSPLLLDSFDDGSTRFFEWAENTSYYELRSDIATHGSHALFLPDTTGNSRFVRTGSEITTYPADAYPRVGDRVRWSIRTPDPANTHVYIRLAYETGWDTYECRVQFSTGDIGLRKVKGGATESQSTTSPLAFSADTWYPCEFVWGTGGTLTFTVTAPDGSSSASVTLNDLEYTNGGISLSRNTTTESNRWAIDGLRIIRRAW